MYKFLAVVFFLFFSMSPFNCLATNSSSVIINELAWMGTTASANDEWIELYNNTENPITLDGWALKAADGTPEIGLAGIISAKAFCLLERTNDDTVPGIVADKIYTGALGNSGEDLKLFDSSGNLVDEANFSSGWTDGDNSTKQTLERVGPAWQTSQAPGGTPKAQNSAITPQNALPLSAEQAKQVESQKIDEDKPAEIGSPLAYPSGIVFTELMPSPEGADEVEEYIKIYNKNVFDVDLTGWKIKDAIGSSTTYTFPETKIAKSEYLVLTRPDTKITLNNSGDKVILFNPNNEIVDAVEYPKALAGEPYKRTNADWQWESALTIGQKNNTNKGEENEITDKEKFLASLNQGVSFDNKSFLYLLLTAGIIALISTVVIIFLKRKIIK